MSLQEIKNLKKNQKGFTIVELLIVIVVIGILAAIVIVAYNGIQNRAKNTGAQTSAENLAKKVEAFNSVTGAYPVYNAAGTVTTQLAANKESDLTGSGVTIAYSGISGSNGQGTVQLKLCGATAPAAGSAATGYEVWAWDYTLAAPALAKAQSGGVTTNCVVSTSGS